MAFDQQAKDDFERAAGRAFWRKILTLFTGENNELLPFDEVRKRLTIRGQNYTGLKQVDIAKIVGSMGRYKDFDRAFLPVQSRTRDRWISIDKAHYEQVPLPPVELYKIGEIYFVKDGNHRVSVARERGQAFVDAFVTEIHIPIVLTPDVKVDDLVLKQERATFLEQTRLFELRPEARIEITLPGQYDKLREHIAVHRWYQGEQRQAEVPYPEAVESWYENVYCPLVDIIREQGILKEFPGRTETDLYLWIIERLWYLKEVYGEEVPIERAAEQFVEDASQRPVRRVVKAIKKVTGKK